VALLRERQLLEKRNGNRSVFSGYIASVTEHGSACPKHAVSVPHAFTVLPQAHSS
jgi:hypothetical protein